MFRMMTREFARRFIFAVWCLAAGMGHVSVSLAVTHHLSTISNLSTQKTVRMTQQILKNISPDAYYPEMGIIHPDEGAIFPRDIASPYIIWDDPFLNSNLWLIILDLSDHESIYCLTDKTTWVPDRTTWELVKKMSLGQSFRMTIIGVNQRDGLRVITSSSRTLHISCDAFEDYIFFKQTLLPFLASSKNPELSRWILADIASYESPQVVLDGLSTCANCHAFSRDGKKFGMDVDIRGDKGGYVVSGVKSEMCIGSREFMTWNDFQPADGKTSMGLFSRFSPDGRYIASTVKETSLFAMLNNIYFSQLFFPIEGKIACYDTKAKRFFPLTGADKSSFIQTCPEWSPDGRTIVFSRAPVDPELLAVMAGKKFLTLRPGQTIFDLNRLYRIRFDICRITFNNGKGGTPLLIAGASQNGKSNYFPRYSPDGRWIVFNQSDTGLVLQPDSTLYIIPAKGGTPRRLQCNTGQMNSWHSWASNGKWLAFASKALTPYTEILITHIDENGRASPPIALNRLNREGYAAVIPEVVNLSGKPIRRIRFTDVLISD